MPALPQSSANAATSGTFTLLYALGAKSDDGSNPEGSLAVVKGIIYSATRYSYDYDPSHGSVIGVRLSGHEKVVCTLEGPGEPLAGLTGVQGTVFGTGYVGGSSDGGAVFSLTPSCMMRVLHSFRGGRDGAHPRADLLYFNGKLYGTTEDGGGPHHGCGSQCGTVFTVGIAGGHEVVYRFRGYTHGDGSRPFAGLIRVRGLFYGTTEVGGAYDRGTVYSLSPSGRERVLHSFGAPGDGQLPFAGLDYAHGRLFGTTWQGGAYQGPYGGAGTVFSLSTSGKERVVYNFRAGDDGANPVSGLVSRNGTLYGTTRGGGIGSCRCGTIFSVTAGGRERVLHSFQDDDGSAPGELVDVAGKLFGSAYSGGRYGKGTIFSFDP